VKDFPIDLDRIVRGDVGDDRIRKIIRYGNALELAKRRVDRDARERAVAAFARELARGPIAVETEAANAQHYEVPADFFRLVLGRRMKYSAGYWHDGATIDASEEAMLELSCERARIGDGQRILDLGCGWGSLSLYMAERWPSARIVGLTNSRSQKAFIDVRATASGLSNLSIQVGDVSSWQGEGRFDRVVSVEMFEHMRNYEALLEKIASWMAPGATLFVHIFSHATHAYTFGGNWMAETFFRGGLMPSDDLLPRFQKDLRLLEHHRLSGVHYQKTNEAWLARLTANKDMALAVLAREGSEADAARAFAAWRLFFMVAAESFGHDGGRQWMLSHYLFGEGR
jgi:cyclopropane-fatty-acyl-phospholipid synthase